MGNIRFTKDQQKVIDVHNRNILVSAAAGSGKTAVLVERIIQMVIDESNKTTIDRLLVVTFTNAAASEMRERIGEALYQAIEQHPEKEHLRDQLTLLPSASIMTLHAFCLQVIRNYFYEIDLDPSFKIGDEAELVLLKQEVLETVLEDFYIEATPEFHELVEAYGRGKTDKALEEIIANVYRMSMSHPSPLDWLKESVKLMAIKTADDWYKSIYVDAMMTEVVSTIIALKKAINDGFQMIEGQEPLMPMGETFSIYFEMIECLEDKIEDRKSLFEMIEQLEFPRAKSAKRGTDKSLVEPVKEVLASVKDGLKGLKDHYGYRIDKAFLERIQISYGHMEVLTRLIQAYKEAYDTSKASRNLIDFNDIEHFALKILESEDIASRYKDQYDEIMVDEYQDSNLVQETLIVRVSRVGQGTPNIFMVGDMKQSIYKFRLAKPELFADKFEHYTLEDSLYQKIELHQNFRSRTEVLDFTNYIFKQVMSRELGDVDYDDHAALNKGASYTIESNQYKTKIALIDAQSYPGKTTQEIEACNVAQEIQKIIGMDPPLMVYDKAMDTQRKVQYKDIAVLLRTMSGWSEVFVDTFTDYSIPVKSHTATGYFDALEIQTILNVLTIIDNPKQDIPLLAVMKSPMFDFTADELVKIRMASKHMDFHSALRAFYDSILGTSELEHKVSVFVETLVEWRQWVKEMTLHELTLGILRETGYYDYVALMIGGPQRQANLDMFLDQVYRYEKSSYKGLFDFIRYMSHIKKHSIDYGMAELLDHSVNQTTIMSIHKSKGLEFPVVIVAGLNKQFNRMDLNKAVLLHQDMGFATDTILTKKRLKYPSPIKQVLRNRMDIEMKSEELRILYVAMTRAREKLILMGSLKDTDKYLSKWCKVLTEDAIAINPYSVKDGQSYMDYIVMSLIRHSEMAEQIKPLGYDYRAPIALSDIAPDIEIEIYRANESDTMSEQQALAIETAMSEPLGIEEQWDLSKLKWVYDYQSSTEKHISQSVSELKKNEQEEIPYAGPKLESVSYKPQFITGERLLSGAQKGTVFHKVMDQLDLTQTYDLDRVDAFLNNLVIKGILTSKEIESVYNVSVLKFLKSDLGMRVKKAAIKGKSHQEKPFVMGFEEEEVKGIMMIQGVIDLYFEEDEELILVDYKTDYMKGIEEHELVERYLGQMKHYQKALEQSSGKKVKEIYLYSVGLQKAIEVDIMTTR